MEFSCIRCSSKRCLVCADPSVSSLTRTPRLLPWRGSQDSASRRYRAHCERSCFSANSLQTRRQTQSLSDFLNYFGTICLDRCPPPQLRTAPRTFLGQVSLQRAVSCRTSASRAECLPPAFYSRRRSSCRKRVPSAWLWLRGSSVASTASAGPLSPAAHGSSLKPRQSPSQPLSPRFDLILFSVKQERIFGSFAAF